MFVQEDSNLKFGVSPLQTLNHIITLGARFSVFFEFSERVRQTRAWSSETVTAESQKGVFAGRLVRQRSVNLTGEGECIQTASRLQGVIV